MLQASHEKKIGRVTKGFKVSITAIATTNANTAAGDEGPNARKAHRQWFTEAVPGAKKDGQKGRSSGLDSGKSIMDVLGIDHSTVLDVSLAREAVTQFVTSFMDKCLDMLINDLLACSSKRVQDASNSRMCRLNAAASPATSKH